MKALLKHVSRSLVAGIVALLPIGGSVLTVIWIEGLLAETWNSVPDLRPYYLPGLGILAAICTVYLTGLVVSTFLGRWLFRMVDRLLDRLPLLGGLYQTLKQILGYGEGEEALFQHVVLVRSRDDVGEELGLVTHRLGAGEGERIVVFVPGSPNPTTGRLLVVAPSALRRIPMSVHDALKALVSVGKADIPLAAGTTR